MTRGPLYYREREKESGKSGENYDDRVACVTLMFGCLSVCVCVCVYRICAGCKQGSSEGEREGDGEGEGERGQVRSFQWEEILAARVEV